jgi:hypothetical protein
MILIIFGGAVNRNTIFWNVIFITISYPLHVSAHLQARLTPPPKTLITDATLKNKKLPWFVKG